MVPQITPHHEKSNVILSDLPLLLCVCLSLLVHGNGMMMDQFGPRSLKSSDGQSRIVGGQRAPSKRYPYTVSLQSFSSHSCGASLIAPDLVLAAAHCQGGIQQILVNPHRLSSPQPQSETFAPLKEIVHPLYQSVTDNDHDFMIIKMNGNSSLSPIRVNSLNSLPGEGAQLRAIGWGSLFDGGTIPDVLHHVNLTYLDNGACAQATLSGFSSYEGEITDDMMCTLEPNKDACQGDSGGPLVFAGADSSSDVQVGIVSWGHGCALANYPGVYARTSHEWSWIRATVCNNSDDPPADYRCEEGGATFSPRPSLTPTAPTTSPAPSGQKTDVLIKLVLDSYNRETGFRIKDIEGEIVFEKPSGSYTSEFEVYETISLSSNEEFVLTILDSFGDGFAGIFAVYFGVEEDNGKLLAYYDGLEDFSFATEKDIPFGVGERYIISVFPTGAPVFLSPQPSAEPSSPTFSPAPTSDEALILVRIVLDLWPQETGWRIETIDGTIVADVPAGTYEGAVGVIIREELILEPNQNYNFVLIDSHGNGFQGEAMIFLDSDSKNNILAYFNASFAFFSGELVLPFLTSTDGVIQVAPTMAPTAPTIVPSTEPSAPTISPAPSSRLVDIIVSLTTDAFPRESGWTIKDAEGEAVFFVEPSTYTEAFSTYNEKVELLVNQDFTFIIIDAFGNGFHGEVIVYLGDTPANENVILFYEGGIPGVAAFFNHSQGFRSSYNATITSFPARPTTTGAPSDAPPNPSSSLAPSGLMIDVCIVIELDSFPTETGFTIEGPQGEVSYQVSAGKYTTPFAFETELVLLLRDQIYTLNILDSFGDGFEGTLSVYLGETHDASKILANYEGPQGDFDTHSISFTTSEFVFPTMAPSTPIASPSDSSAAPSTSLSPSAFEVKVAVVLELDSFPEETGWRIEDWNGVVIVEVVSLAPGSNLTDDNVEIRSRVRESRTHTERKMALQSGMFTPVEVVTLEKNKEYTFVLTDTFGDGFKGKAVVYLGETPMEDKVLVYHDGLSASGHTQTYPFINGALGVLDIVVIPPREIQLSMAFNFSPLVLEWYLFDDETGSLLAEKSPSDVYPVSFTFFYAGPAKPLYLYIYQSGRVLDGSYSISHDGRTVATGDQDFGTSRYHYFEVGSPSSHIPVTAFAKQIEDSFYPVLSWDWVQYGGAQYAKSFSKGLETDGSMATTRFIPEGGLFKMCVNNNTNVVGSYHMTVGSVDPFNGRVLSSDQSMYTFVSKESYERPTVESDAAHLVLEISFGNIDSASVRWILYAGKEHTTPVAEARQASTTSLDGFEIFVFGPESPYPSSLSESNAETIPLPSIRMGGSQEFAFVLYSDKVGLLYKVYDGEREIVVGNLTSDEEIHMFTINGPLLGENSLGNVSTTMSTSPGPSSSDSAKAKAWTLFICAITHTFML